MHWVLLNTNLFPFFFFSITTCLISYLLCNIALGFFFLKLFLISLNPIHILHFLGTDPRYQWLLLTQLWAQLPAALSLVSHLYPVRTRHPSSHVQCPASLQTPPTPHSSLSSAVLPELRGILWMRSMSDLLFGSSSVPRTGLCKNLEHNTCMLNWIESCALFLSF